MLVTISLVNHSMTCENLSLTLMLDNFQIIFIIFSDLIFIQGTDVIFKVALVLLGNHKELIMQCNSFESIVEFIKTTLPEMGMIQMERVINQVLFLWLHDSVIYYAPHIDRLGLGYIVILLSIHLS